MAIAGRQLGPDVFAFRLGRIDILNDGGFARLVFINIDGRIIEPTIVVPIDAVSSAILEMTKATAIGLMGTAERVCN